MEITSGIILSRPNRWLNGSRGFSVVIDGMEAGNIQNGSSIKIPLSPGPHTIQCRMAWLSSRQLLVECKSNQFDYLVVTSGMTYYWPAYSILIAGICLKWLMQAGGMSRPAWAIIAELLLILPPLLYMLFYLTMARRRYLLLDEDFENALAG